MRNLALIALAVSGVVLVSCGGGASENAQVESIAHRYFTALGSGNGSELCSLVTGETKRELVEDVEKIEAEHGRESGNLTCPAVVMALHAQLGQDEIAGLKGAKVKVESLSASSATVLVTGSNGRSTDVTLSKTDAGWLISKVPASAST